MNDAFLNLHPKTQKSLARSNEARLFLAWAATPDLLPHGDIQQFRATLYSIRRDVLEQEQVQEQAFVNFRLKELRRACEGG